MRRAYADTPEGQVHYVTEGSGEPLLLLHESPRSWATYVRMIPLLAKTHRVIAMDNLGFGDSDPPSQAYQVEDYAENVAHFLDSLGIAQTSVMGDHTGASIAVEVAVRWPERVRRLVLAGLPFWISKEERLARLEQEKTSNSGSIDVDGAHCTRLWQRALAKVPREANGEVSQDDLEFVAGYTLDGLKAGPYNKETHMAVYSYDPEPRLPLIQAPTLVVDVTGEGPTQYTKRGSQVKALIPQSSLVTIEGGGSRLKIIRATELSETMLQFLDSSTL